MEQTISRLMFCPECEKEGRPKRGNYYVLKEGTDCWVEQDTKVHRGSERGLVPHHIQLIMTQNDTATLRVVCAMDNCGFAVAKHKNGKVRIFFEFMGEDKVLYQIPVKKKKGKFHFEANGKNYEVTDETKLIERAFELQDKVREIQIPKKEWMALKRYIFKLL